MVFRQSWRAEDSALDLPVCGGNGAPAHAAGHGSVHHWRAGHGCCDWPGEWRRVQAGPAVLPAIGWRGYRTGGSHGWIRRFLSTAGAWSYPPTDRVLLLGVWIAGSLCSDLPCGSEAYVPAAAEVAGIKLYLEEQKSRAEI